MTKEITSAKEITKAPYYVVTTDSFMSGWGLSEHKNNVLIFPCESYMEAVIVEANAKGRSDQKRVHITSNKPRLNTRSNFYQMPEYPDYKHWYTPGSWGANDLIVANVYHNGKHSRLWLNVRDLEEIIVRAGWTVVNDLENADTWQAKREIEWLEAKEYVSGKFDNASEEALQWWNQHLLRETPALTPDI